MGTEILIILLLILCNGLFAMGEIAIISSRKARLQEKAEAGDRGASLALELAKEPTRFLSTIQIGITLIGILAGAFGGATVAQDLARLLGRIPRLAPYSRGLSVGIVVSVITYLSLVVGELIPKRIALSQPERIASAIARLMRFLAALLAPAVHLVSFSTDLVLKTLGIHPPSEPLVTEEEVKILIEQGTQGGVFDEVEQDIVERALRLGDRKVSGIMTPRTEVVWLDTEDPPEEILRKLMESTHTWYPVGRDILDDVQGVVRAKDLVMRELSNEPIDLTALLYPPLFIPESMSALQALEFLKKAQSHLALVIDEYGSIQGIVSIHDILEAIVGEMPALDGLDEPEAIQREDGSWLLDGMLSIDEFKEIFNLGRLPGEEEGDYQTVGGLVMTSLGRIPTTGDHFQLSGLRLEVMDMDGYRVDKVMVVPAQPDVGTEEARPENGPLFGINHKN